MSGNCWSILKLERDSDERSIRRQYAALLKVTRPDDDPEGFQRLRQAYEDALHHARRRAAEVEQHEGAQQGREEPVLEFALEGETSVAPQTRALTLDQPRFTPLPVELPAANEWPRQQMDELFAQLNINTVAHCLHTAQQQGWQAAFEPRLLELCLGDHPDAQVLAEWALVTFDWLRPWQPNPLPPPRMKRLADRLLAWNFEALDRLLGDAQESAALDQVDTLLASPWLESLDRQAWVQRCLMGWLVESHDWSPDFFRALCTRLNIQADDYQTQQDPLWNALLERFEEQRVLSLLRQQLAQKKAVLLADQASWLLLKDLSAGQRRRLIDQMTAEAWNACAQLEDLLLNGFPRLLERLGRSHLPDWRQWCPKPESRAWRGWLMLACFVTAQLPELWSMRDIDPAFAFDPRVLASSLAMAGFCLMVVIGGTYVWYGLTTWLARPDAWLSNLLLPRALTQQGTGVLLFRHVLPSVALGIGCGMWVSPTVGQWPALAYGALVTLLALIYGCGRLRLLGGARNKSFGKPWVGAQTAKALSIAAIVALVGFVSMFHERGRPECELGSRGQAVCLKRPQLMPLPEPRVAPVVAKPSVSAAPTTPAKAPSAATTAPAAKPAAAKPAAAKTPPPAPRQVPVSPPPKAAPNAYQLGETLTSPSNLLPDETLTPISGPQKKMELKYK